MTYSLHPGAEQEIADALDFYTERAGLIVAQRFLTEFERVAQLLVEHPGFGTPTTKGRRVFPNSEVDRIEPAPHPPSVISEP